MRIFKTKWFHRWARRERLNDNSLRNVIADMDRGLVDADPGGHIYLQAESSGSRARQKWWSAYADCLSAGG
ncbi:MAG: type II toxin-antitoxin system RelE/ParE family toxin [Gammaproteobacteria bacterium]|nr:type II toxin-antitoxin system RelE/ParE family toxin [Gammaproteobacteria bacterium]MDE0512093.1 type II toxin-antitoxin system RelE/ParE family toxin [Gammaproteobacteria bacterium]